MSHNGHICDVSVVTCAQATHYNNNVFYFYREQQGNVAYLTDISK